MRRRRMAGWLAGLAMTALACGLQQAHRADEPPEFSAERLGDLSEQDSILDLLDPAEREAFERSGVSGARPEHVATPADKRESTSDSVGKAGLSVLVVALSAAAAAAPFLLF